MEKAGVHDARHLFNDKECRRQGSPHTPGCVMHLHADEQRIRQNRGGEEHLAMTNFCRWATMNGYLP